MDERIKNISGKVQPNPKKDALSGDRNNVTLS